MATPAENIITNTVPRGGLGLNPSLFNGSVLAKAVIGGTFSVAVLGAAGIAVTTVAVRAGSRPPVPEDDSMTMYKNQIITFDPTLNDKPVAGKEVEETLTLTKISTPANGFVEFEDNQVTYTPVLGWIGQETLQYTVSNKHASAEGTIVIDVLNHVPIATDDEYIVHKNVPAVLAVLENDEDDDNDELIIEEVSETEKGATVTHNSTHIFYTAPPTAATDSFTYKITDSHSHDTATVFITIQNDPPVAEPDHYRVLMNSGDHLSKIMSNDYDPNMDDIYITSVGPVENVMFLVDGTYTNALEDVHISEVTFSPNYNFEGGESFNYILTDNVGESVSGLVSVDVINEPPQAEDREFNLWKNEGFSLDMNDLVSDDNNYASLTIEVSEPPTYGTVTLDVVEEDITTTYQGQEISYVQRTYTMNYTPMEDTYYYENFAYTVSDGVYSATGRISVTVVNRAPESQDLVFDFSREPVAHDLTSVLFETVEDIDGDEIILVSVTPDSKMEVGDHSLVYTVSNGSPGSYTEFFEYTIKDNVLEAGNELYSTSTITINIHNDGPECTPQVFEFPKSARKTVNSICITDCDERDVCYDFVDEVKVESITGITNPLLVSRVTPSNFKSQLLVEIAGGYSGSSDINFVASDGDPSLDVTSYITVNVINHAPEAYNYEQDIHKGQVLNSIRVDTYDIDGDLPKIVGLRTVDEQPFSTSDAIVINGSAASVNFASNTIRFVAGDSYSETQSFQFYYVVSDGDNNNPLMAEAMVTLNMDINLPVAHDDSVSYTVVQGAGAYAPLFIDIDVLANDEDIDGDPLSIVEVFYDPEVAYISTDCAHAAECIKYIPPPPDSPDACKTVQFDYSMKSTDGQANATVTVTPSCTCDMLVDLGIVLDRSGSITTAEFNDGVRFAHDLINSFNSVGQDGVMPSVFYYNDVAEALMSVDYSATQNRDNVLNQVSSLIGTSTEGSTGTGDAIAAAHYDLSTNTLRPDAAKVLVVVSDGKSNVGDVPAIDAALAFKREGGSIYTIATKTTYAQSGAALELREVAGYLDREIEVDEGYYYLVDAYDKLDAVKDKIMNTMCSA